METLLQRVYFHNTLEDWMIALAIVAVTFAILGIAGPRVIRRLEKAARRTTMVYDDILVMASKKFILPFLYIGGCYAGLSYLSFPDKGEKVIHGILLVLFTFFILRIISAAIQYVVFSFLSRQEGGETKQKQARGFIIITRFAVWTIGIVFLLDNLGYNVSAILAGLGVGGIAIALAAQTVLGDLFSYFVIFFDRPFEIGDFIIFGNEMGTVEYVGVKSTRIRTLNGQLLVCSNKDLTNSRVNNYKRMEKRRVVFRLGVVYQVPADKLEAIPAMVKKIITADRSVELDRGHFVGFGESSLDFEFVYYVPSPDYNTYMDIQQAICYAIFRRFEEEEIEFAYPTRTVYTMNAA